MRLFEQKIHQNFTSNFYFKFTIFPQIFDFQIHKTCEMYEKVLHNRSKLDKNNFLLVRYEDMALNQMKTAEEIYAFIGSKMDDSVKKWVENEISFAEENFDLYSTHRNSTYTVTKWRKMLKFGEVQKVQKICKNVMEEAGYKIFGNLENLQNYKLPAFLPNYL